MNSLRATNLCGTLAALSLLIVASAQAVGPGNGLRRPDLRIGQLRNTSTMLGNDIYNADAGGQRIRIFLTDQRWSNYFFALEDEGNSGNKSDSIRLLATASNRFIETRYFRLSGGRTNITAQVTRAGVVETVSDGSLVRYQGMVRSRSTRLSPEQRVVLRARSATDTSEVDAVRATVRRRGM